MIVLGNFSRRLGDNSRSRGRERGRRVQVLYRPDAGSEWTIYPGVLKFPGSSLFDRTGTITINNIQKGEYAFGIRDSGRVVSDTQIVNSPCFVLGEQDIEQSVKSGLNFQVFPNPIKDSFYIRFDSPVPTDVRISVSDLSGRRVTQLVIAKGLDRLDVSTRGWNKTVYLLRIENSKGAAVKKVMVLN